MKLIDILVYELPKRGGWPEGVEEIWQDYDRLMRPGMWGWFHHELSEDHRPQHHDAKVKISRKQYEAAIAAQQPAWNGDGLPPVGCECEIKRVADWMPVTIKFISDYHTVFKTFGGTEDCYQTCSLQFRPIRTEVERKREASIAAMCSFFGHASGLYNLPGFYEKIASGEIPGVRLSDD